MNGYYPDWEAIAAIGQVVGAAGVILSLVYLAIQVRDDARERRAAAVHQQSMAFTAALHAIAADETLASVIVRGRKNLASLSETEFLRFNVSLSGSLRVWEDSYLQYREGRLSEQIWNGMEAPLSFIFSHPGMQAFWRSAANNHSPEFRDLVNTKISQAAQVIAAPAAPPPAIVEPNNS